MQPIQSQLFALKDESYRDFQIKLIPTVQPERVIGVRTPILKQFAKQIVRDGIAEDFLKRLPHEYFDEDQLHAFILNDVKNFGECLSKTRDFLPYIDNWATCDQLSPKVFVKHGDELFPQIVEWVNSLSTYQIRFGIKMLMQHFLDERFDVSQAKLVAAVSFDDYYVKMMVAWYFATALAKQYDAVLPFIEKRSLDEWTHDKTIQKAVESFRIPTERKNYLKSLKRRGKS